MGSASYTDVVFSPDPVGASLLAMNDNAVYLIKPAIP